MLRNVLIADDDARWLSEINPHSNFYRYKVVDNLGAALIEIEGDVDWDAAIFDRYLMANDLPFQNGKLCGEAGFVLAMVFQRRFPGKRMIIATGSLEGPPSNISEVLHSDLCIYVHKHSKDAATRVLRFFKGYPDRVRWSEQLLKYLLLQPNFCGLGLDLGRVLETLVTWAQNSGASSHSQRQHRRCISKEERFVLVYSGDQNAPDKEITSIPHGTACVLVYDEKTGDAILEAEMLEEHLGSEIKAPHRVICIDTKAGLESILAGLHASVPRFLIVHTPTTDESSYWQDLFMKILAQDPNAMLAVVSEEAALMTEEDFGRTNIIGIFETPFHYANMLPALCTAMKNQLLKTDADQK